MPCSAQRRCQYTAPTKGVSKDIRHLRILLWFPHCPNWRVTISRGIARRDTRHVTNFSCCFCFSCVFCVHAQAWPAWSLRRFYSLTNQSITHPEARHSVLTTNQSQAEHSVSIYQKERCCTSTILRVFGLPKPGANSQRQRCHQESYRQQNSRCFPLENLKMLPSRSRKARHWTC